MSSDDSPPLGQRLGTRKAHIQNSDDELPDWAASFKSPYTGGLKPRVSSSDDEKDMPTSKPAGQDTSGAHDAGKPLQAQSPKQEAHAAANKPEPAKDPPCSQRRGESAGLSNSGRQAGDARGGPSGSQSQADDVKGGSARKGALPRLPAPGSSKSAGASAPNDSENKQVATEHKAEGGGAAEGSNAGKKETSLVLPDKLPRNKVMAELCPGEDDQLIDLAGDSGAVGRMIVAGEQGSEQLQIDLKGAMFDATALPLAGTAMVVNIGPNEAKVEALLNDYLSFQPVEGLHDDEDGGYGKDLMVSDDDNYQPEQVPQGQAGSPKVKGSKKKATKTGAKSSRAGSLTGGSKQGGCVRKKAAPKKAAATKSKPKK